MKLAIFTVLGLIISFPQAYAWKESMSEARSHLKPEMATEEILKARLKISLARYADDQAYLAGEKQLSSREMILQNLRPGDIVLARSANLLGSMSARASDIPGQFAHLIFISQDPQSGELKAIESDQGVGVTVSAPSQSISGGATRIALFRHKDPALAERASQALWSHVSEKLKNGGHIDYDNHLDVNDHSTLYCTEVATLAFSLIGEKVPASLSHASFLNPKLQKQLAIQSQWIFTPQDLEIDPRFDLVMEYRNLPRLQDVYRKDALFAKYFEWIKDGKIRLRSNPIGSFVGFVGNQFFSEEVAKATGTTDRRQNTNYISYVFEVYTTLSRFEQLLQLETKGKNTQFYTVDDYENLLEEILQHEKDKVLEVN